MKFALFNGGWWRVCPETENLINCKGATAGKLSLHKGVVEIVDVNGPEELDMSKCIDDNYPVIFGWMNRAGEVFEHDLFNESYAEDNFDTSSQFLLESGWVKLTVCSFQQDYESKTELSDMQKKRLKSWRVHLFEAV